MKRVVRRLVRRAMSLAFLGVLAGCGPRTPVIVDGKVWKELAGECYRIPVSYLTLESHFGPSRAMTVKFSNAEMLERIEGYQVPLMTNGKPLDGSGVLVFVPTPDQLAQIRVNQAIILKQGHDKWFAQGDWTRRTIEPAPESGLRRLFLFPEHKNVWEVLDGVPDASSAADLTRNFHVASCYLEPDMRQSSCLLNLERDGFFMDFDTSEPNLPLRDQIADHFMAKFAEWKVNCAERER